MMKQLGWSILCLVPLVAACGKKQTVDQPSAPVAGANKPEAPPLVYGTAIEASSGRPLSGVLIQGPDGSKTYSDELGRFELHGLPAGASGSLIASTPDGRSGRNLLRPLVAGPLEVVLFIR